MDAIFHLGNALQNGLGDFAGSYFLAHEHFMKLVSSQLA
jgi:hypothetical protein